jgi:hypothetical protein
MMARAARPRSRRRRLARSDPYLPTGAGVDLVRNIAYFDSHSLGRPLAVLAAWLALGVALTAAFAGARPRGLGTTEDHDRQRAEAEALVGAGAG